MRFHFLLPIGLATSIGLVAPACSSSSPSSFDFSDSGGSSGSGSGGSSGGSSGGTGSSSGSFPGDGGGLVGDGNTSGPEASDGSVVVTNTIYAHTDTVLYSVNPMSPSTVTMVGTFAGTSDAETDSAVTDLAVNAAGDVFVNTESVVYSAALPASNGGTVQLTKVASIQGTAKFYALAFTPAGVLGSGETLVGGDSNGALWVIDTSNGATTNLGTFGNDPMTSGNVFELSGDIVFYLDPMNNMAPTGLATIRSCKSGSSSTCGTDFLAGINMTNLKSAYTSMTASSALLGGIYGATTSSDGPGTGFHDVFGLAAWNSSVFGFTREGKTAGAASLISISTSGSNAGVGTLISSTFPFTEDGWSGAGVTTTVKITLPTPPPPPAQ